MSCIILLLNQISKGKKEKNQKNKIKK